MYPSDLAGVEEWAHDYAFMIALLMRNLLAMTSARQTDQWRDIVV